MGLHLYISHTIEQKLSEQHIRFEKKERSILGLNYYHLHWKNHKADRVHIPFVYPPKITIYDAIVFLDNTTDSPTPPSTPSSTPIVILTQNLKLYLPEQDLLLPSVSGTVSPNLDLQGENLSIQKNENGIQAEGTYHHTFFPDPVSFFIERDQQHDIHFSIELPSFSYTHSLLSSLPVMIPSSLVTGTLISNHIQLQISVEKSKFYGKGDIQKSPLRIETEWHGNLTLDTLHTLFPLSQEIQTTGSFPFRAHFSWPEKNWSLELQPTKLEVIGSLFDPQTFRYGKFPHYSPSTQKGYSSGPITKFWLRYEDLGWMKETTVAAEDASFWSHPGYSIPSIQEAIQDYKTKGTLRGGSTITQQLAKNLFLSSEKTLERKVHELFYTLCLERDLSKKELLTTYLNVVEFGPDVHGVKSASQLYFLKQPNRLSLVEASYLASVLPAPTRFFRTAQRRKTVPRGRTNRVLENLKNLDIISYDEYISSVQEPLVVIPPPE